MFCPKCGSNLEDGSTFCAKCGTKIVQEGTNAGNASSQKVSQQPTQQGFTQSNMQSVNPGVQQPVKKKKIWIPIVAVVAVLMILIVALGSGDDESVSENGTSDNTEVSSELQGTADEEMISMVKGGSPTIIPDITYEEAYENFFAKPTWRYFVSTDAEDVVEFSGECTYADDPAEVYIQFLLHDDNSFEIYYAKLECNGEEVDDETIMCQLVYNPFSDYAEDVLGEPLSEDVEAEFQAWYEESIQTDGFSEEE